MNKTFEDSPYRFHHDSQGRLVSIPSVPEMEAYLALDQNKGNFVQVRLGKSVSPDKRSFLDSLWRQMEVSPAVSQICPEILYTGLEKGIPFYVSSLPAGEPLSDYVRRNGPLPVETAVELVRNWVSAIRDLPPFDFNELAVAPESIWIALGTDSKPRIMLGDLSPTRHPDAEGVNAQLCLNLLKFLSGNPPLDEAFQSLCVSLTSSPMQLETVQKLLEAYLALHSASPHWQQIIPPLPFLHQVVPPEMVILAGTPQPTPATDSISELHFPSESFSDNDPLPRTGSSPEETRPLSPGLLRLAGVAIAAVVLAGLTMFSLRLFFVEKEEITTHETLSAGTVTSPSTPGIALAADRETVDSMAIDQPEGRLLSEFSHGDTPGSYEPETIEISGSPLPKAEVVLSNYQSLASEARTNKDFFAALGYELAALEEDPASVESRLRLGLDLKVIADRVTAAPLSQAETVVLERAARVHSQAFDILVRHYRDQSLWEKEIATLLEQAKRGHPEKLSEAGQRIFENPDSKEADYQAARSYFVEAAAQGDPNGQFFAGECFILGKGGEKDYSQGCQYLRQAADQGDVRAMDLLGVCHIRSWGVTRDDAKAVALFQQAIEGNFVPAYYNLGARYAQGQGVERDAGKAADAFEKGSLKGNPNCMLVLGRCYETGFGREADFGKAVFWFSKAAAAGNAEAIEWCDKNHIDYTKHLTAGN